MYCSSFLCKSFLQPDRCIVCFLCIIKKSNKLAVYLHLVRVWPNMYLNVDFKYRQVLSLSELPAIGISLTPAKATRDLKKKKIKIWTLMLRSVFGGRVVYLITEAPLSTKFSRILWCSEIWLYIIFENWHRKWENWIKFQNHRKTRGLCFVVYFLVFASRSGLLIGAQKSGKSWTVGTRQIIHNKR